jgi:hypothetical protein
MGITAEPPDPEEEVPLAVLAADTQAAIDELRLRRRLARFLRLRRSSRARPAAGPA